jgi:hypothetical protein
LESPIAHQSTLLDPHVQDYICDTGYASGVTFGALFHGGVAEAAGEFNHTVMYFDANRAGRDAFVTSEFGENLLLNLSVIVQC